MSDAKKPLLIVALGSLDPPSGRLLRKAALLARAQKASLRLVHAIAIPYGPSTTNSVTTRRAAQSIVTHRKAQLRKICRRPELRGISTSVEVVWDYPASDALIRQVLASKPAMLVAESRPHRRLASMWLSNTDWDLIRNCPCPLWLVKSDRPLTGAPILAAIDPFHAHAKTAALDNVILKHALGIAGGRPARVNVCHVYYPPPPIVIDGVAGPYWLPLTDVEQPVWEANVRRAVGRTARRHGIPPANAIVLIGDPAVELPEVARARKAGVLVMGAVSRSGLQRLFIGHTAERVIDGVDCDVLIVKPRGFRTPVARRPLPVYGFTAD